MRVLRLILGIIILTQGVVSRDLVYCSLGALLAIMAIANMGCCGVNGCNIPVDSPAQQTEKKDKEYEELVQK